MEWLQAFMIAGSTIGACYMMHRENRQLSERFAQETKDFHGRLCTIEERYHNTLRDLIREKK